MTAADPRPESERLRTQIANISRWARLHPWSFRVDADRLNLDDSFWAALGRQPPDDTAITLDHWTAAIHPGDRQDMVREFDRLLSDPACLFYQCQYRLQHADGRWLWFFDSGGVIARDAAGKALEISGVVQDVTALKEAEEALCAQQTRYDAVAEATRRQSRILAAMGEAASLLLGDQDEGFSAILDKVLERLGTANEVDRVYIWQTHQGENGRLRCTQIHEWSPSAPPVQGTDIAVDIDFEDNIPGWREKLSAGRCINGLVRDLSPAERAQLEPQGIVSILVAPIRFEDHFWGFIGFDDCRAERVWSEPEAAVLTSAGLLVANAIKRRSIQVALETALERARENARAAEAASRAKIDFLVNVSRNIRFPMASVAQTADSLLSSDLSDVQRAGVEAVREQMAAAALLVDDLLDYSQIEAGRLDIVAAPFDFAPLVEDICEEWAPPCQRRGVEFTLQWEAARLPARIAGDARRIRQALYCLIGRAVRRTVAGEVVTQVVACRTADGKPGARFAVMDTGPAILPDEMERLAAGLADSGADERHHGGTGLELPLTRALVALMKGEMGVLAQPGEEGSTCWIQLPLAAVESPAPPPPLGGRALVLDANANARTALRMALEACGVAVDEAETAAGAQTLGMANAYDWGFVGSALDSAHLEFMGRKFQRLPGFERARWVMTPAAAHSDRAVGFTKLGFSALLFKPLRQARVYECLGGDRDESSMGIPAAPVAVAAGGDDADAAAMARADDPPKDPRP